MVAVLSLMVRCLLCFAGVLVACKSDLVQRREVSEKRGRELAASKDLHYFDTSAVSGIVMSTLSPTMQFINHLASALPTEGPPVCGGAIPTPSLPVQPTVPAECASATGNDVTLIKFCVYMCVYTCVYAIVNKQEVHIK